MRMKSTELNNFLGFRKDLEEPQLNRYRNDLADKGMVNMMKYWLQCYFNRLRLWRAET